MAARDHRLLLVPYPGFPKTAAGDKQGVVGRTVGPHRSPGTATSIPGLLFTLLREQSRGQKDAGRGVRDLRLDLGWKVWGSSAATAACSDGTPRSPEVPIPASFPKSPNKDRTRRPLQRAPLQQTADGPQCFPSGWGSPLRDSSSQGFYFSSSCPTSRRFPPSDMAGITLSIFLLNNFILAAFPSTRGWGGRKCILYTL